MTTTASLPVITPSRADDESRMRLVPVPTGRVPLVDRALMRLGLALLLASAQHANRAEQQQAPRRIGLDRRPIGSARPFC